MNYPRQANLCHKVVYVFIVWYMYWLFIYLYMLTKVYQLSSMKPVVYNLDDLSKNNVST